jgi:hypothetical protein
MFFGAYWLVDGIFSIIHIFLKNSDLHWSWLLSRGIIGILPEIILLRHPLLSALFGPTVTVWIMGFMGGVHQPRVSSPYANREKHIPTTSTGQNFLIKNRQNIDNIALLC